MCNAIFVIIMCSLASVSSSNCATLFENDESFTSDIARFSLDSWDIEDSFDKVLILGTANALVREEEPVTVNHLELKGKPEILEKVVIGIQDGVLVITAPDGSEPIEIFLRLPKGTLTSIHHSGNGRYLFQGENFSANGGGGYFNEA